MTTPSQSVIPLDIGEPTTPDGPARIVWRQQYDFNRDALERELSASKNTEPSLTHQKFTEDADINITLKRFGVTDGSYLPGLDADHPVYDPKYYGNFEEATDLKTALDQFRTAQERFMELPASIRSRFQNNWYELYEWVADPKNGKEAVQLGLLAETPAPIPTTPAAPAPPATQTP